MLPQGALSITRFSARGRSARNGMCGHSNRPNHIVGTASGADGHRRPAHQRDGDHQHVEQHMDAAGGEAFPARPCPRATPESDWRAATPDATALSIRMVNPIDLWSWNSGNVRSSVSSSLVMKKPSPSMNRIIAAISPVQRHRNGAVAYSAVAPDHAGGDQRCSCSNSAAMRSFTSSLTVGFQIILVRPKSLRLIVVSAENPSW